MRLVFAASCQRTRSSHRAPIEERGGGCTAHPLGIPMGMVTTFFGQAGKAVGIGEGP
jgi:hypothetical protein